MNIFKRALVTVAVIATQLDKTGGEDTKAVFPLSNEDNEASPVDEPGILTLTAFPLSNENNEASPVVAPTILPLAASKSGHKPTLGARAAVLKPGGRLPDDHTGPDPFVLKFHRHLEAQNQDQMRAALKDLTKTNSTNDRNS